MKVGVIGDVMLDVFQEGSVDRISPEAPVPVLLNPNGYDVLGGAANAALNISGLGAQCLLLGAVGDDAPGRRCRELAEASGLEHELITISEWRTTVKHRFMASGQQVLRVDTEMPMPMDLAPELLGGVVDFAAVNAIVLSDYDKGVVTDSLARMVIRQAHSRGIPVVVDSKRLDPSLFVDCTVITPNRLEAFRMTGSSDPEIAARRIAAITCSAVLVTLGADGMLLVDGDRVDHIGSVAREVADITGAGDSVVAGLAIAIAEGRGLYDAARFGAAVAAVAVGHKGTHAVQRTSVREGSLP